MAMSNSVPNLHGSSALSFPHSRSDPHHKAALMPQSGLLQHKLPTGQPNVYVPSAWNKAIVQSAPPIAVHPGLSGQATVLPLGSSGYDVQHLQYAVQRDRWARMVHRPAVEMISLVITAMYEVGDKRRNTRMNIIGVSTIHLMVSE